MKANTDYKDIWLYPYNLATVCESNVSVNLVWAHYQCCQSIKKVLQTGNINRGSRVNDATVRAHTVSARCSCFDFETHISFCGVGELQSGSDNICKRAWGGHTKTTVISLYVCY